MSETGPTLYPLMRYADAPAAIEFLKRAFGFRDLERIDNPDGTIAHAELTYGSSVLMLSSDRDDPRLGRRAGKGWIYVAVPDADEHYRRARDAEVEILTEPFDTDYARVITARSTSKATNGISAPIARHRWTPRRRLRELASLTAERRQGRPPRLSREAVIDAARVIVERDGIDALTMRRVAQELGSSAMAIYRHVRDKDELLVLLLDRLAAELPRPRFSRDPRRRVQQASRFMHDSLARYGWVVDVLAQGDLIAPEILWLIEEIVAGLMACGLSESQAADGYRAIWQFTVGALIIRRGLERTAALGRPPFVVGVLLGVDADQFPALASMREYWAPARDRDAYDIGCSALLDGLLHDRA